MSEHNIDIGEPKTREEIAMGKVIDPFSEPWPFYHITDVDRLESILRNGLVSADFAARARIPNYVSDYGSSWNRRFISLYEGSLSDFSTPSDQVVAVIVRPTDQAIMATEKLRKLTDFHFSVRDEALVKYRISPKEIMGISLGEDFTTGGRSISLQNSRIERILEIMNSLDPKLAVPIFTAGQRLIWPVKMTREELANKVQSQK